MNRARTHNQIRFMFKFSSFSYRVSLSLFKSYIIDLFLYIYIYIYIFFFWLSTQLVYSTNPPEPKSKTARTNTPTVDGKLPPIEPNAFESVGVFPFPKPEQPDLIINPETPWDIRRFFDKNIQNPTMFEINRRKFTWNPSNRTRSGEISSRSSLDPARS